MSKRILSVGSEDGSSEINRPTKKMAFTKEQLKFEDLENGEALTECLTSVQSGISELMDVSFTTTDLVRFLTTVVIRQQRKIESLENDMTDLKCRSMRDNILVHGIAEKDTDNPEKEMTDFLSKLPGINKTDLKFERVHRIGVKGNNNKPRPLVGKFSFYKTKEKVMNAKPARPKNTKSQVNRDPYITHQFPMEIVEQRRQLSEHANNVVGSTKAKITLDVNRLRINGQIQKPPIITPSPADLLSLEDDERAAIKSAVPFKDITETGDHPVEGVQIFKCSKEPQSLNEIRKAYNAFMLLPGAMTRHHNAIAYTLEDGTRGYCDNGDLGLGHTALKAFGEATKNRVLFISRARTNTNIGSERFDFINSVASKYDD